MRRRKLPAIAVASLAVLGLSTLGPAAASAEGLPRQLAWTAYDVGSAGYNQAVAIGSALKNELGVDLRVLPGKNDISRQIPLREGKVHFSATGVGASWMAQEGVFEFGAKEWGPQAVRVLLANNSNANLSLGCAADAGVETIADMKGKRIAWVVGSPSLNQNAEAIMAFGGLTWDDVERVDFPGFGQSWDGIINNQVDCAFAVTTSGKAYQLEASPRGIHWPPLPREDEEGWKRLKAKAPFFVPNTATIGAGISEDKPFHGAAYPYPILIAYADQDEDLVYAMTKAMVELFPKYKDGAPGIEGWAIDRQILDWVVPYHPGAIRYFEEIGVWSDEYQEHNERLIERQRALATAWEEATAAGLEDPEKFEKVWMEARAKALEAAGFDPVYR